MRYPQMDSDVIEKVTEWDSAPVTDGYAGLQKLTEREFSGVVTNGTAWLFMLNGRAVGVFDGVIEDFDGTDGTAYTAPDPALPLLFAMLERGGETRAKYYTNDTPLSEADDTLTEGNFTGYVELSENVLSGDYYLVYYGGRSMSAAYVGNSRQLLTGQEAFERADGEVGIYEVAAVDIDVVELPEPDPEEAADAAEPETTVDASTNESTESPEDETAFEGDGDAEDLPPEADVTGGADASADASDEDVQETPDTGDEAWDAPESDEGDVVPDAESSESPSVTDVETAAADSTVEGDAADERRVEPLDVESPEGESPPADAESPTAPAKTESTPAPAKAESTPSDDLPSEATVASEVPEDDDVFSEEAQWRETTSIPSLDPERSGSPRPERLAGRAHGPAEAVEREHRDAPTDEPADRSGETVDRLRRRLGRLENDLGRAEKERDRLESERDEFREEAARLRELVDELEAEVANLRSALAEAGDAGATVDQRLSSSRALGGTNLFVRYDSKGAGTLEKAHSGDATRAQVNENLRIEHHTNFDAGAVAVDGRSFESFLTNTVEYGFVRWVVEDLLYEVRDTGTERALSGLYDAIPKIDRAEFDGTVEVDEEEGAVSRTFDVVLRDRMGSPLLVANLNTSRDPATDGMMGTLIEDASIVTDGDDGLGAAFLVTASYFDPPALETASEATGGGLLRREKRKSFVKLSRKRGFHLCLVETRNDEFHVSVPEL